MRAVGVYRLGHGNLIAALMPIQKRKVFTSETELKEQVQKHEDCYNRAAKARVGGK